MVVSAFLLITCFAFGKLLFCAAKKVPARARS